MDIRLMKKEAREILKGSFAKTFWVYLIYSFVPSLVCIGDPFFIQMNPLLYGLLMTLYSMFVIMPLTIGAANYFVKLTNGKEPRISEVLSGYNLFSRNILSCVTAVIYILPAVLLYVVVLVGSAQSSPVISLVATAIYIIFIVLYALAISQYPFILADDSYNDRRGKEVLFLSCDMMSGYKLKLFALEISFFFWILLVIATLGIAGFYVGPYMMCAKANFYKYVNDKHYEKAINTTDVKW